MYRSILKALLAVMFFLTLSTTLLAQQTGSIVGTVVDTTGAVVPNAQVSLINTATKDIRHTTTNNEGFFAFSGAVSGDYSIKVESQGFKAAEQVGIHLGPGDRRNLNFSLAVGAGEQVITVEAQASQLQVVDSGDLSSTLFAKNISNLALQGRDVTELVRTLPGFNNNTSYNGLQNKTGYDTQITSIASSVGRGYSANGTPDRAGGADLVSDGAHILDPGCNCNATQTVNPDMVAEVKVTTSAYSADSVTGPIVVSAVSKSGTTEYHGSAYLHFRDSALNSNDWSYNHSQLARPNDRYWYPGGQFGGPVPFTHKKLTFFTGFEYYNQSFPEQMSNGVLKAMLPTMSERAGHFDPTLSDNAAVCRSIQASTISDHRRCEAITSIDTVNGYVAGITNSDISAYIAPGAKALLKLVPQPNHTPTPSAAYNWVMPLMNTNNGYMFHTRADYSFNDSTKLYVSYNQQHELYGSPVQRWWLPGNSIGWPGDAATSSLSRTISGNLVKVLNPTTTNEFLASLSYLSGPLTIGNEKAVDRAALGYPYTYPGSKIMPSIQNGWYNNDFGIPQMLDSGRIDYFIRKLQPSISDNLTKVLGTHTVKAGFSWLRSGNRESNVDQGSGANGTVTYGPLWDFNGPGSSQIMSAQNPVLDFMLDLPSGLTYQPTTVADVYDSSIAFYGQDEWKVNKRLTVNFGLRFSHETPWTDANGKVGGAAFSQAWYDADLANKVTYLPGMRWHAIDKSVPLSGHTLDAMFYGPRFGIAYDVFGTSKTVVRGGFGSYYYHDYVAGAPFSVAQGGTKCSSSGITFLSQIDKGTNVSCANTGGGVTSATAFDRNDHVEPRTYTYNFTVSQQMPLASLLEVSYVGSQSEDLLNPLQDINIMPIGAFAKPDPNPESANYGRLLPISQLNANNNQEQQDFKPYTHYQNLGLIRHGAWANYNALQVSWSKQRGSLTFNLNYTFSKTLGIGTKADPINMHNDYGLLNQDRTHVFNASYAFEVGNRFHSRLGSVALNGWMISGILNLQSGASLQGWNSNNLNFGGKDSLGTDLNSTYYLGQAAGSNGTGYTLMPVLTCNPGNAQISGQYINPNCFSLPSPPQFNSAGVMTKVGGQGQYQWPYLRGPAYFSSDLSLSRTVRITERQNVQVKFTGLNFLNHPLWSFDQNNANNVNLNFNNGVLASQSNGVPYGFPSEKFGRRVLEMTLRYNF